MNKGYVGFPEIENYRLEIRNAKHSRHIFFINTKIVWKMFEKLFIINFHLYGTANHVKGVRFSAYSS